MRTDGSDASFDDVFGGRRRYVVFVASARGTRRAPDRCMQPPKESRPGLDPEREAMRQLDEIPLDSIIDIDPEDPSQLLDDASQYADLDLEIEAQPDTEAGADFAAALADSAGEEGALDDDALGFEEAARELDTPAETTADAIADAASDEDTGDLYGVHIPPADPDFDLTGDQESFEDSELGEHVFETLEKETAEAGAEPEHVLDLVDTSDEHVQHHSTERRDRPVADKGSGGIGGL